MNKQEIQEIISHLQSSIKRRCRMINDMTFATEYTLQNAKDSVTDKKLWRCYHENKTLRNLYVKDQILEKKMLKHFYMQLKNLHRQ